MNRMRRTLPLPVLLILAVSLSAASPAEKNRGGKRDVAASAPSGKIAVSIRDWKGVEELVKAHRGKVVVVDIWTTTCLACIEEFPEFVALERQFGRDKIALISLNCDYDGIEGKPPQYYRKQVLAFLQRQKARFDNVMLNIPLLDFLEQIDLASTPAVLVYDQQGKLVKRFDNDDIKKAEEEFTMRDVKRLVGQLIEANEE